VKGIEPSSRSTSSNEGEFPAYDDSGTFPWTFPDVMTKVMTVASLHKDPRGRSPYWYCAYTLPNGKRAFKSTKETDRQKAQAFCSTLQRASNLGAGGSLTEARARDLISEIVEASLGEPLKFYTPEEWALRN